MYAKREVSFCTPLGKNMGTLKNSEYLSVKSLGQIYNTFQD